MRNFISIDNNTARSYLDAMLSLTRILLFILLAAFAVGSVIHTAGTTTMSVNMALANASDMEMADWEMADCTGCDTNKDGNQGGVSCDIACIAPFMANLGHETAPGPRMPALHEATGLFDFVGLTSPPEPYPPRSLILI